MGQLEVFGVCIVAVGAFVYWLLRANHHERAGNSDPYISPEYESSSRSHSTATVPEARSSDKRTTTTRRRFSNDIHSPRDLRRLLSKAEVHIQQRRATKTRIRYCYRDKTATYYNQIINNQGIMKKYRKDYHGDPKSPINGRLYGLFFSVNVQHGTHEPVSPSVYGERRLLIQPEMLHQQCRNLYFADFYCVHEPHFVTLVMTHSGSAADRFCRQHLIPINWENNSFFTRSYSGVYSVTNSGVWVEVFFTEDIDIMEMLRDGAQWKDVEMRGLRTGGRTGIRKKSSCDVCNI